MMYLQAPHRLFPDERPSVARLVQLVLCDDGWARIDAYRVSPVRCRSARLAPLIAVSHSIQMAYEHVYGIKLSDREAEAHIHRRASIQQRLTRGRYADGFDSRT